MIESEIKVEEIEECTSYGRIVEKRRLIETPLGYFICDDWAECIAEFSGWNKDAAPAQ